MKRAKDRRTFLPRRPDERVRTDNFENVSHRWPPALFSGFNLRLQAPASSILLAYQSETVPRTPVSISISASVLVSSDIRQFSGTPEADIGKSPQSARS